MLVEGTLLLFFVYLWSWLTNSKCRELDGEHLVTFGGDVAQVGCIKFHPVSPVLEMCKTGWWFQLSFIFTPIWGRFPF